MTNKEKLARLLLFTANEATPAVLPTRWWGTEIQALDPKTKELKTYGGPNVPGFMRVAAEQYCQRNGLGYCKVLDELVAEIPCKEGSFTPDFGGTIDYEAPGLN